MASQETVTVYCDANPLLLFTKLLQLRIKVSERPINLPHFRSKLFRLKRDASPASAGELRVTLYPSDALMKFCTTLLARDFDLDVIQ